MKALVSLFGRRGLLALLALVLLSLAIWFGGPYLAFADRKPFDSAVGRLVAILVLAIAWSLWAQVQAVRGRQKDERLAKDLAAQKDAPEAAAAAGRAAAGGAGDTRAGGASPADGRQLRQRFEEAIASLRRRGKRASLYDLPWYVVIGPPGSGKTTAIVNSGLEFPLAQEFGRNALRGVGGTRNCDWWFTDRAVLLDTAGRYTTQDSDAQADAAGWREFLELLRRYRKRRPINGVLIVMSAAELLTMPEAERGAHVQAIRQRLDELHRHLRIALPAYVLLTKCDLLAGFNESFDDLGQEGRAQVWGATFELEDSRGGSAAARLGMHLEALLERLRDRNVLRIEQERDVQRRASMLAFPGQFAALRRPLCELVEGVFAQGPASAGLMLRGVYLTSGTQEGTPVDRLLGALARTYGLTPSPVPAQPGRGKAYFIRRLLDEVVFAESGLAGVDRRTELRHALVQGAAYAAVASVAILGLVWLALSFGRNRAYLEEVQIAASRLAELPAVSAQDASVAGRPTSLDVMRSALSRLDALSEVVRTAEQHAGSVPLAMRAGLYQGRSVGNAARDAYLAELNRTLMPAAAAHFGARLDGSAGDPDALYEYLKAYLMLGEPQHLQPQQLGYVAEAEWRRSFADDPFLAERISSHFAALIADPSRVQPAPLDAGRIEAARNSLKQASLPRLVYSRLRLSHAGSAQGALDVQQEIGLGAQAVFTRRSGVPLSQPLSALYTRKVFDEIAGTGRLDAVRDFMDETWVLGEGAASLADAPRIAYEVMQLYEQDYIRAWDALLADLQVKPVSGTSELAEQMTLLASASSPLKGLLAMVESNTNLMRPAAGGDAGAQAGARAAGQAAVQTLGATKAGAALGQVLGVPPGAAQPGQQVTRHFEPIHRLLAGPAGAAPIDQMLRTLGDVQQRLAGMGGGLGQSGALEALAGAGQGDALMQLRATAKQLPAPLDAMLAQLGSRGESAARGEARGELLGRYRSQVVTECRQLIGGRYPFEAGATDDVALADFGRLFGHGGVFDTFFKETLAPLVDTGRDPWRWKEGAAAIGGSAGLLEQFRAVDRIRRVYFPPGGQLPEMQFTLSPQALDAAATKLTVEIDGQVMEYRHGPQRAVAMRWPGPAPGRAAVRFEEGGGLGPNRSWRGPWALFHLLEDANLQAQSEVRYLVTLALDGRNASLALEAASVRNPLVRNELRRFRCEL